MNESGENKRKARSVSAVLKTALPVALASIYGILNQYCLKMVGGPIGGLIADKILKSPTKYLFYTFIISGDCPVKPLFSCRTKVCRCIWGMVCTLGFGALLFHSARDFFAPIGEPISKSQSTGATNGTGQFIGYV